MCIITFVCAQVPIYMFLCNVYVEDTYTFLFKNIRIYIIQLPQKKGKFLFGFSMNEHYTFFPSITKRVL